MGEDAVRLEPLAGGVGVNAVWSVLVNRQLAVGRLGRRGEAVGWETGLLAHLHREGMPVPVPIPNADGRYVADGLVVMTYVEGRLPETDADWRRVAAGLRQLHPTHARRAATPGLAVVDRPPARRAGTKVDLGAMPSEGVLRCRAASARLTAELSI